MKIVQCMGGWCKSRSNCAHYWANKLPFREPIERLCGENEEMEPILIYKQNSAQMAKHIEQTAINA